MYFYFRVLLSCGVNMSGSAKDSLCPSIVTDVYETLFLKVEDYTIDSRGDVGAW